MFAKILHANDGSAPAFNALKLALTLAQQNQSELHMVSVMEVDYLPEFVEEIRKKPAGPPDAFVAFCSARRTWLSRRISSFTPIS